MDFPLLKNQLQSLLANETDLIANMANMAALIFHEFDDINWAGFYIVRDNQLVLGPFQGKIACVRIPFGKGVCGNAAKNKLSILVDNVHEFPGHIACDSSSNSELVIPIIVNNKTFALFDIDSPRIGRFTNEDKAGVEKLIEVFTDCTKLEL